MDTSRSKATDIWDRYHRTRDEELRNELVIAYLPLVRYVAGRLRQQLPAFVDVDDLVSYGVFGLVDAIDRYDPAWGTKFETFGAPRIRGAILDELRALDWAPRSVRSAARGVERGVEDLRASLGREPGDGEIAAHMDVAVDEVRRARSNAASAVLDSLQPSFGSGLDAEDLQPAAAGSSDPATEAEVTVLHERLGLGESKVCQLYTASALLLRERLAVLR